MSLSSGGALRAATSASISGLSPLCLTGIQCVPLMKKRVKSSVYLHSGEGFRSCKSPLMDDHGRDEGREHPGMPVWDSSRNSLFCVAYVARDGPCGDRLLSVYQTPRMWSKGRGINRHKNSIHCCCCSVTQSCMTVCDPMECSIPAFPVLHYLPEFAQILSH